MNNKSNSAIFFEVTYWIGVLLLFFGFVIDKWFIIALAILLALFSLFEEHPDNLKKFAKMQFIVFYLLGSLLIMLSLATDSFNSLFTGAIIAIFSIVLFKSKYHEYKKTSQIELKEIKPQKVITKLDFKHTPPKVKSKFSLSKLLSFKFLKRNKPFIKPIIKPIIKKPVKNVIKPKSQFKIKNLMFILVYLIVLILIGIAYKTNNLIIIIVAVVICIINFGTSLRKKLRANKPLTAFKPQTANILKIKSKSLEPLKVPEKPLKPLKTPIVPKRIDLEAIKKLVKQKLPYQTDIDVLYALIKEYKKRKISEIAKIFGVSKEKAEEWANILEESQLAKLHYPAMGEPELISII